LFLKGEADMTARKVVVYYAWSRPGETEAPLEVIENRFPTLFESRRMGYPRFEELADPSQFDQGVGGFLDHIMKRNFTAFVELAESLTGQPVAEIERVADNGAVTALDARVLDRADTLILISFDSFRTGQEAGNGEIEAVRRFLAQPDRLAFVCPHHDVGDVPDLSHHELMRRQLERVGDAVNRLDVLARQKIDLTAPPHPFARERTSFDALLQSRADAFAGTLLVGDTTLWSSTAGGLESLRQFWTNVVQRPRRP
jgi:hypothetical protein